MADNSSEEKTEEPTPRKRRKTREEGQVAKSVEVPSVFVLFAGVVVLYFFADYLRNDILDIMRSCFRFNGTTEISPASLLLILEQYIKAFFILLMPLLIAVFFAALATNIVQVGFQISPKSIEPKLSKINVIKGFGRLFSMKSLGELAKSLLKFVIIGGVLYVNLRKELFALSMLPDMETAQILIYILRVAFKIFIWVLLIMVVLALLDYVFQRWQFEKQIRMTRQELKDEMKQTEGDPHVKSRIRSLQQQAAKKRMMKQVPEADVVVTNPTHLAVAIRYDHLSMAAPRVVAKGAGLVAERIKAVATENQIPVIENKELARNLYKYVEVEAEIPANLFRAVAELLAYVYRIKGKIV
ncbi:MAG: flagellar biosynthesis protein FlhB [Thermodesulfobacteriota bacterium]|nr:flagellar biosynthesis protein FlhB [Thermodesulfobacteriota bacterium]